MSDETATLRIGVDRSEVDSEASDVQRVVDDLGEKWTALKTVVREEGRAMLRSFSSLISGVRSTLRAIGITLDPVQEALLSVIAATVQMLLSVSASLASTGVGAPAGAYLAVIAFAFQVGATIAAINGMSQAKDEFQRASDMMESWGSFARSLSRGGLF